MAVTARARFVHVMRGWAADEARAIEQMLNRPCETKTTAADKWAEMNAVPADLAKHHADSYIARMEATTAARAERRWAFVESQCAKHGVSLGQ